VKLTGSRRQNPREFLNLLSVETGSPWVPRSLFVNIRRSSFVVMTKGVMGRVDNGVSRHTPLNPRGLPMSVMAEPVFSVAPSSPHSNGILLNSRNAHQAVTRMIRQALQRQDDLVLSLKYQDKKGETTERIVSPIRFLAPNRFLALCLCRCEPRQFQVDRCSDMQLKPASDYVMPVQLSTSHAPLPHPTSKITELDHATG
jgi:hypothetical protein